MNEQTRDQTLFEIDDDEVREADLLSTKLDGWLDDERFDVDVELLENVADIVPLVDFLTTIDMPPRLEFAATLKDRLLNSPPADIDGEITSEGTDSQFSWLVVAAAFASVMLLGTLISLAVALWLMVQPGSAPVIMPLPTPTFTVTNTPTPTLTATPTVEPTAGSSSTGDTLRLPTATPTVSPSPTLPPTAAPTARLPATSTPTPSPTSTPPVSPPNFSRSDDDGSNSNPVIGGGSNNDTE